MEEIRCSVKVLVVWREAGLSSLAISSCGGVTGSGVAPDIGVATADCESSIERTAAKAVELRCPLLQPIPTCKRK